MAGRSFALRAAMAATAPQLATNMIWRQHILEDAKARLEAGEGYGNVARSIGVSRHTLRAALEHYDMLPIAFGKWHPIETAPDDRTILVANSSTMEVLWAKQGSEYAQWGWTHWMLLPSLPRGETQ
jgi:hypothetical protein